MIVLSTEQIEKSLAQIEQIDANTKGAIEAILKDYNEFKSKVIQALNEQREVIVELKGAYELDRLKREEIKKAAINCIKSE